MQFPGGEPQCANVDHLLRLPGTINFPNQKKLTRGRKVAPTRVLANDGGLHGRQAFGHVGAPAKATIDVTFGAPEEVVLDSLDLPDELVTIIRNGEGAKPKPGDNSRSSWLFVEVDPRCAA